MQAYILPRAEFNSLASYMVKKNDKIVITRGPRSGQEATVMEVLGDGVKARTSDGTVLGNIRNGHYRVK